MSQDAPAPPSRPLFRKLAFGVAIICFVLAAVFTFTTPEIFPRIVCLVVGFIMLVIGATGNWPPKIRK
jgi:peptidoglycan/LPS O-acetylase OafA/YrhL